MKSRLLELLVCPTCDGSLECKVFLRTDRQSRAAYRLNEEGKVFCQNICSFTDNSWVGNILPNKISCKDCFDIEIEQGLLSCHACHAHYPIINGIPRLLPKELQVPLRHYHPQYFKKYSYLLPDILAEESHKSKDKVRRMKLSTLKSFSFQWNTFSQIYPQYREDFLDYISPVGPSFFPGKLCMDAGCGFGRFSYYAAEFGAEVIGIDLSKAVEAAYRNTKHLSNVHIVQADLYHLPFRENIFDFVYSIGVLHHLPDPKTGFMKLIPFMKEGGSTFIWVYGNKIPGKDDLILAMRKITTKLPFALLYLYCYLLAASTYYPYEILSRIPLVKKIADFIPYKSYIRYPFRVGHQDWFDRLSVPLVRFFSKEEILNWFEEAGLKDILITWRPKRGWRGFGKRPYKQKNANRKK